MTTARKITLALLALDALSVVAAFNLVAWSRGLLGHGDLILSPLLLPVVIHFLGVHLIDGYSSRTDMMSVTYASLHVIAQVGVLLVTLLLTYAFIPAGFPLQTSRLVTTVSYLAVVPLSLGYRRLFYAGLLARSEQTYFVFIGHAEACLSFKEECRQHQMRQRVLYATVAGGGWAESAGTGEAEPGEDALGLLDRHAGRIDAVILRETNQELPAALAQRLMELNFSGVPTYTLELFHQVYWRKIPLYRLNQAWLFQEGFQIAREPVFERLKRLSDLVLAAVGLVACAPLFPVVAALIKLGDGGPVFYRQTRVGRNRVLFTALKFRTMRAEAGGGAYTRLDDPRVTRCGRLLRATRLDEVPQLWNVLRGDMSLIGPRAEWVRLVEEYERQIPCYHFRHLVKPGITGWAQVNYPYGASLDDTLRKLEYDLYYIRFFSFVLDASIVLKTIHVMLRGKGR